MKKDDSRMSFVVEVIRPLDGRSVGYPFPIKPRWKHDCSKCEFLGYWMDYDLYYCDGANETVLARYGNEPQEYLSGAGSSMTPLVLAERMAIRRGLMR